MPSKQRCGIRRLRVLIGVMVFLACMFSYMLRMSFNLLIVAMVFPLPVNRSGPGCGPLYGGGERPPDYGPRYRWGQDAQGYALAAHGYGFVLTQLPGAVLVDAMGARVLIFTAALVMAASTALLPLCANVHWGLVFASRLVVGLGGGAVYPAVHALVACWAPPRERYLFNWALMGGSMCTVLTWPVCALLVITLGWRLCLYVLSALVTVWALLWLALVRDGPERHPCITDDERDYIASCMGDGTDTHRGLLPLGQVFSSGAFYALLFLHVGNCWGLHLFIIEMPKFLTEMLGMDLFKVSEATPPLWAQAAGYASLPQLIRLLAGLAFGAGVHYALMAQKMRVTTVRKLFTIFSHLIPGAMLMAMGFVGCHVPLHLALMTLCLGFNGASTVTNLANHHDLAPNLAGSLYSIMNGIGSTTAFIVPQITGYLLFALGNELAQWRIVFLISAALYLLAGLLFVVLGTAVPQPWNYRPPPRSSSAADRATAGSGGDETGRDKDES